MTAISKDSRTAEGHSTTSSKPVETNRKKMGKYRSRFAIAATILEVAQAGNASKTRLMYGSFLSFAQINEYLNFLLSNELIVRNDDTHAYGLTEKGLRFLHIYNEIAQILPIDEPVLPV